MTVIPPDARPDEIAQALDKGQQQLKDLRLGGPGRSLPGIALKAFRSRDPAEVIRNIETLRSDLRTVDVLLAQTYERSVSLEEEDAARHPFGTAWKNVLRRRLSEETDATTRRNEALTHWSEALASSQFHCAREVAELDVLREGLRAIRDDLVAISVGLDRLREIESPVRRDWSKVLGAAEHVVGSQRGLPDVVVTRLLVLRSRILRRLARDRTAALAVASEAVTRVGSGPLQSRDLAVAAVAEVYLDAGRFDDAHDLLDGALEGDAFAADLLIAAGRLAEVEDDHDTAEECFDAVAVRLGADAGTEHLLVEVPGTLLWRTARRIRSSDPQVALDLIARALDAGVGGSRAFPERRPMLERARILDQLDDDRTEAAAAYHDAAERYSWSGSKRALSLYERAVQLDPDDPGLRWSYAEALRLQAMEQPWAPDHGLLQQAQDELGAGLERATPSREQTWVYVTAALLDDVEGDGADPTIAIERALLVDRSYARGLAFLSQLLRRRGFVIEALEAARLGADVDRFDDFVVLEHVRALTDLDEGQEAIRVAEEHLAQVGFDPDLSFAKATLERRSGDLDAARETLQEAEDEGADEAAVLQQRAMTAAAEDDVDEERACYRRMLEVMGPSAHPSAIGWTEYRLGNLDDAVERFDQVLALPDPVASCGLDLGQVLLARGGADDLRRGRDLLLSTTSESMVVDDLVHVRTEELVLLERAVHGTAHEAAVLTVVHDARAAIDDRLSELRGRRRAADDRSARLAAARMAEAEKRADRALTILREVDAAGDAPPELPGRVAAIADLVVNEGDEELRHGNAAKARELWSSALPTRGDAAVRLALADLEERGSDDPAVAAALRDADPACLRDALRVFARDVPSLWEHLDALRSTDAGTEAGADDRLDVSEVERELVRAVYVTDRDAVPPLSVSPFVVPIEVGLARAQARLEDDTMIQAGIPRLRQAISDEMGVQIPGVAVAVDDALAADEVRFDVYGRTVAVVSLPDDPDAVRSMIAERFEDVLRDNLFRWVTVDELDLWASGWDAFSVDDDGDADDFAYWVVEDAAARLRLTRVLRTLLREGVPISDRAAIRAGFETAEDTDRLDTFEQVAEVRRRLGPVLVGPDPDVEVRPLPEELEAAVASGLKPGRWDAWLMPRPQVTSLVGELRRWLEADDARPVAVSVRDPHVRPYVWHLLAAERPRVYVVAAEEVGR